MAYFRKNDLLLKVSLSDKIKPLHIGINNIFMTKRISKPFSNSEPFWSKMVFSSENGLLLRVSHFPRVSRFYSKGLTLGKWLTFSKERHLLEQEILF
jgi:hypothetical protein